MNIENKKEELRNNILGAYEYRLETSIKIEDEKQKITKNKYTIEILENKLSAINGCIKEYKKELFELDIHTDIQEQIEDFELAIKTAEDIKEVYRHEIEFYEIDKDNICFEMIAFNRKNIEELENTIKDMKEKTAELLKIYNLKNSFNDDEYVFENLACDDDYDALDDFDKDFHDDGKYTDYQAWSLNELFNDDGSY